MIVRYVPLAGIILSTLVRLAPAWACGALPCAQRDDVQPADGSVGVPRNTELRVLYFGSREYDAACDVDLRPMRLAPGAGEPILLTGVAFERPSAAQTWMIARHVEPLAADTSYALQLLLGGGEACSCEGREWTTVATFTTGPDEDDAKPAFEGLEEVAYGARASDSSDCGASDRVPVNAGFTPAVDASPGLRYNIYVDGEIANRNVDLEQARQRGGEIFVDCGSASLSTRTDVLPGAALEVRAVDLAGNESAPSQAITLAAVCQDRIDGGVDDGFIDDGFIDDGGEIDAGAPAAPTGPVATASGCALAYQPGVAPLALGALPALVMLRRVRRRRARSSPRQGRPR